jgi:hypothetical protein
LNKVRTERHMTGARPIRAATKLVIPMDNPSESLMFPSCLAAKSADAHDSCSGDRNR